jgi:hypothetical protein
VIKYTNYYFQSDFTKKIKLRRKFLQVVKCSLGFLKLYLSELSTKLTSFEESNSQLLNSLNIFSEIENISINILKIILKILKYVLEKNEGYKTIKTYSDYEIMIGNQNVYLNITPNVLNYFKYASITSFDVERTFSL